MVSVPTERLVLREFRPEDFPAVQQYGSDPHVVEFLPWGPNTEDETREFITRQVAAQEQVPRLSYGLAVALKADDHVIGGCGLCLSAGSDRHGWIRYCLARRFWGCGYATEAARALVAFGFGEFRLHRIFATCDVRNVASAHVLEKLGMTREGHLREDKFIRGHWRDSYVYAILEHEWARHRQDISKELS